jgi:hypothetical protein
MSFIARLLGGGARQAGSPVGSPRGGGSGAAPDVAPDELVDVRFK